LIEKQIDAKDRKDKAMITIRKSNERGHANHGWLEARHTFSFAEYHDRAHMGFRSLRVINEDRIAPGMGFGTHPHNDMEILTWVLSGALAHKDSTGGGSTLRPNMIQHMTAGSGITHSEFNPSTDESTHLLQIWMRPEARALKPSYSEREFDPADWRGKFKTLASRDGADNSVIVRQDASLSVAELKAGESGTRSLKPERHAWIQVTSGSVSVNGVTLETGDGAAVSEESELSFAGLEDGQVLLFDLN
jgi:redox-sensitive bicupin YhaK (pirin superfamily)